MKYLIAIVVLLMATNVFAAGRVNPFTGQPLTYSLSEMHVRESMGAGAYDRMRRQTFTYRQSLQSAMGPRARLSYADHGSESRLDRETGMVEEISYEYAEYDREVLTGERRMPYGLARFNGPQHNYYYMENNEPSNNKTSNNEPSPFTRKFKKLFK